MATWKMLIQREMDAHGESWAEVCGHTFREGQLDTEFYDGYGSTNGCPFTLWTTHRVYFPIKYDGAEWCGSAPRNPCDEASKHQGCG